jgi:hypothetical protein
MKHLSAVLWLLVAVCAGCKNKEQTIVPTMEKMQTVCIGRHLFDLPAGFVPVMPLAAVFNPTNRDSDDSMDINVVAADVTQGSFSAAMLKRRSAIVGVSGDSTDILKDTITGRNSTLFRILRVGDSYTSELHVLKADLHISAELKSYEGRFNQAEADLLSFEKYIVPAAETVIDRQTGFCVGPVVVNTRNKEESVSVTFRSEERPDIVITIEVDTFSRNDPVTLLQRVSGPNSLLAIFDARNEVLRKGELKVAGMRAQEWLGSVKLGENRTRKQFGFALETMRPIPSEAAPRIHIELDTGQNDSYGQKHENSMTDEQAIALWDAMVTRIRPRPGVS